MPRDADIDPEAKVPSPSAEPAVESRPGGALVPADALQRYLAEIRRIPLLSREEEHELAVRWHEHEDRQAAWRLVTANLRLVVMIAREYQRAFHNLLDLVQEGNVGLLEAVKNFDPYRGIRFPSYAVWWIRAYIIRYIMNNWRLVKVGTTQAQRKLVFHLADKEYHRLIRETANEFQKTLKGKDLVIYERRLAPLMRDEEPVTLQEIGDEFGITRERVRQIEARVKKRLADYMRKQIPDIRDIAFGA